MRWYLRSKIHNAAVTEANTAYEGSITIDRELIDKSGLEKGEKVAVWDVTNGERLETYVIEGEEGSGIVCMNGAAAKKIGKGHKIIVAGFELADSGVKPKIVLVDGRNRFVRYL
jgi:aspartate 1-decarboxylase